MLSTEVKTDFKCFKTNAACGIFIQDNTIQRHKLLACVTVWMVLKITVLSERSQTENSTYYMIPFIEILKKVY